MKTLERADGDLIDRLLNRWPFCLDTESVKSVAVAWLFMEGKKWTLLPRRCGTKSLFYNAVFFVRLSLPFGVFASVRWSNSTTERALLQCGAGWKLNGRIAALLRVQSDASSAAGSTGPNYGQAVGWEFGTH